jgi:hypothetical protein
MKTKLRVLALLTSAMVLHGCGGGDMLGSSDAEDYKMTPEEVTEDLTKPRPSENAPVITTEGNNIYWADGRETIFRGINLQYSNAPLDMINGFTGIADTGANVVRIQLSKTTSEGELEAALNAAALNGLAAIITLNDPDLKCQDDEVAFNNAVSDLWLNEWLPIIAQDRYQDKIMINMASGWGPKEVFNGYSFGYRTYMDTYKTAIRQFRKAGLKFPLVVDAPGCGEDYHAFESDRAKELMAADDQKNLIFSVHAYGSTWNTATKIVENMEKLTSQNVPVIMSEFGGSGVGESPVKLASILEKGAGDYAADISVPWKSDADKLAMVLPLAQPIDITNSEVGFDVMLDEAYVTDANLGVQMYLRDSADRYANLKWHSAGEFKAGEWSTQKYPVTNTGSFQYADSGFDLTSVAKVGVELVANGKAPEVAGGIKIDNFKVIEGAGPAITYSEQFEGTTGGWIGTQWEGQPVGIIVADGALELMPKATGLEAGVRGLVGVDYTQPLTIKARMYFPSTLGTGFGFTFYGLDDGWSPVQYVNAGDIILDAWNELSYVADFSKFPGTNGIAIQVYGIPESAIDAGAIKIDSIEIVSQSTGGASETEPGVQYTATFDNDVENWGSYANWGGASADFASENGALKITPKHTGSDDAKVVIRHQNVGNIENLSFSEDPFTVKARIMLPESYAGSEYSFQILFQDSTYNVDVAKTWEFEELPLGEWVELTWPVDFVADLAKGEGFDRAGKPKDFVIQISGNHINDPVLIDEIIIEGMVPVEKEEIIIALADFHYVDEFTRFLPDYIEGALVADELTDIAEIYQRSAPFGWAAWSWFGNDAEHADWDMTETIDSIFGLTDRGVDIVLGKGGIAQILIGNVEIEGSVDD